MIIDTCKVSGVGRENERPQYFVLELFLEFVEYHFQVTHEIELILLSTMANMVHLKADLSQFWNAGI